MLGKQGKSADLEERRRTQYGLRGEAKWVVEIEMWRTQERSNWEERESKENRGGKREKVRNTAEIDL